MAKMATMILYGKNPSNVSSCQRASDVMSWYVALGLTKFGKHSQSNSKHSQDTPSQSFSDDRQRHPQWSLLVSIWPWGYKTYFMVNSTEHDIATAHKN